MQHEARNRAAISVLPPMMDQGFSLCQQEIMFLRMIIDLPKPKYLWLHRQNVQRKIFISTIVILGVSK